jgi:hypothetical protein
MEVAPILLLISTDTAHKCVFALKKGQHVQILSLVEFLQDLVLLACAERSPGNHVDESPVTLG